MNDELQKILDSFLKKVNESSKIQSLNKNGLTYAVAQSYSSLLSEILMECVSEIYPSNSESVLSALKSIALCKSYFNQLDNYVYSLQKAMNEANGLGMNAVTVNKIPQLINGGITSTDDYAHDIRRYSSSVENVSNSRVDYIQRENAKAQSEAGYGVTVSRKYDGKGLSDGRTCKWCMERVGSNLPYKEAYTRGMFERHEGCHCIIEYNNNGKKTYQTDRGGISSWYEKNQRNQNNTDIFEKERRIAKAQGIPYDATKEWNYNPSARVAKVKESESITVEGKKYTVDGNAVVQDHNETEKKIAEMIASKTGKTVFLLPRVVTPHGVQCADYLINNEKWDLKTLQGNSKNVIYNNVHTKKRQSDNFIIDLSKKSISLNEAINQVINNVFKSTHTLFVKKIMIVNSEEIFKVYER